ncbi:MAG: hypothetical protein KA715_11270 [Xanthomonadaceae bacterium]|nr:hypothetical protein [Xanthomonadaceae bacterium]
MKLGEKTQAMKTYQIILTQPIPSSERVESLEARAEILEKLKELDQKLLEIATK